MEMIRTDKIKIPYIYTRAKDSTIAKKIDLIDKGKVPVVTLDVHNVLKDGFYFNLAL